ncbi:nucleoside-triphosphatase THEP1 [Drosophila guanche]|uniref:Blast:Nucleoside-triphosphatase THEP1 n=1 Tax=Drosophila guanche TaxID=7266 RepID=A0A3B0J4U7_DROGU|nr:nucleoside-triphosphatase THEP1 [Drosophila guanche]SPP76904.1 blast:Nucleoside-triphosphatase THEP1 [Drosophila guanche]
MEKIHILTAILITGSPGVGKTTLVRKICSKLGEQRKLQGFYTEEVRTAGKGQRIGFDVVTLSGKRGILAREGPLDNLRRPKVGKYSVYVQDFEDLTLPLLLEGSQSGCELLVIDEVGKMELLSKRFEAAMASVLQQQRLLLATIPQSNRQSLPLVERLKSLPGVVIYEVTKGNRDALVNEITECIIQSKLLA